MVVCWRDSKTPMSIKHLYTSLFPDFFLRLRQESTDRDDAGGAVLRYWCWKNNSSSFSLSSLPSSFCCDRNGQFAIKPVLQPHITCRIFVGQRRSPWCSRVAWCPRALEYSTPTLLLTVVNRRENIWENPFSLVGWKNRSMRDREERERGGHEYWVNWYRCSCVQSPKLHHFFVFPSYFVENFFVIAYLYNCKPWP